MKPLALISIALCLAATGCMVGPKYQRPAQTLPNQFRNGSSSGAVSIADTKWFDLFQDDTLKQLVDTALKNNFDLQIAAEHVLEARAQVGITRSPLFPSLDLNAQFVALRNSGVGSFPFPPGASLTATYTQATVATSWELDLWGRIRKLTEAARAQYLGAEDARRGVLISLISDVMTSYFSLREQDLELDIARRTKDVAQDNLRLIQLRKDRGAATALEVHQAEQFLYTATAQIAATERAIGETEDALSLLLGQAPSDVPRGRSLEQITSAPELPAGAPSALLERRPDILQAEENLIAANAQIGAARALFFPQISLTGDVGGQSHALERLLSVPARIANIGPSATLPIFRAGLRSGVQLTEAQKREMLVTYQKTIYTGMKEVADALINHARTREQRQEQEKLVGALTESVRLSDLRYRGGLDSYLQVLDAERNLFGGQLTLAQLRLEELNSTVQLYRALGGGWQ